MKNIAIYTLYDSLNYGAYLQAYALNKSLKLKNKEVYFVKINGATIYDKTFNKISFFKKMLIKIKNFKSGIYRRKQELKFASCLKKFSIINKDEFLVKGIDGVIIGSDEVWNITNIHFPHIKEFFGYNIPVDKIVSFAPSCNITTSDELRKFDSSINFDNFAHISVRDELTYKLVKDFSVKKIYRILDPTFLLDNYDDEIINCSEKNYVLIYGYKFTNEQIKEIKKFAKIKGMKLISIGLYQSWCDKNVKANPFEFLGYMKNADYVITSTFHGSVFSIILEKQFVSYVGNNSKVLDLLSKFDLLDRNVTDCPCLIDRFNKKIDYIAVNDLKKKMVKQTKEYLDLILKK